jgi:hypothetical protein
MSECVASSLLLGSPRAMMLVRKERLSECVMAT